MFAQKGGMKGMGVTFEMGGGGGGECTEEIQSWLQFDWWYLLRKL